MAIAKGLLRKRQRTEYKSHHLRVKQLRLGDEGDFSSNAVVFGGGDDTTQIASASTDPNFVELRFSNTAASGTARGMYLKLYLGSGAGGEAGRFFTKVSSNTPADTVNGAHISLEFGASAGNVTGLGTAVRCTLHVPNRSLTGTCAAVQAELWAEGTSSACGGILSLMRLSIGGNATGITALTRAAGCVAFHFGAGCVDTTDGVIDSNKTTNTANGCIKIYIDGVGTRWITYGTGA